MTHYGPVSVLAGDVGGTHMRLALAEIVGRNCRWVFERDLESARYASMDAALAEFLRSAAARGRAETACLAVAGPVRVTDSGERVKFTNLPWETDSAALTREFGLRVRLINDFQAVGYGIEALTDEDLGVIQGGEPVAHGPRALIGAGTGLGQAILVWQGDHYEALATEGGHADFAPTDELQVELWRDLRARHGRAGYERILSGAGLVGIYEFLGQRSGMKVAAVAGGDPAAAISAAAQKNSDPLAVQALDLFVRIYGAQAGNLALAAGAVGGVYIAGGIAPKIIAKLQDGAFLHAFLDKGRMAPFLRTIPVQVIMNPKVGLIGAALAASRL